MEKNVEILEAMFQKADSDLNYLSKKLEFEFENTADGKEQMNPVRMLQKIGEIKKEYAGIVQEAAAICQTQKETMDYFRSQLLSACQMLQKLQDSTGSEVMAKPETIGHLEQLLGVDLSQVSSDQKLANPGPAFEGGDNSKKTTIPGDSVSVKTCSASCSSTTNRSLSPVSRRTGSTECIEVDQAEFESVSSLVRGRVKLTDVNTETCCCHIGYSFQKAARDLLYALFQQVYSNLWNHFKKEGNSAPISTSEMYKMGWKITGSTGEAKLKVLRALKLLKLSPKGDVTLT